MRQEKFVGLYRAYGATLLSFGPFIGINLALFERVKELLTNTERGFGVMESFFTGLITGLFSILNLLY